MKNIANKPAKSVTEAVSHLKEALRIAPALPPWNRMMICAGATAIPLMVGLWLSQLPIALFGALMGFLLVLNDHQGKLSHRLKVITFSFVVCASGLLLGLFTHGQKTLFVPVLLGLIYWMALMSAEGAEFERAILFGIFQLLAGYYTPGLAAHLPTVITYAFIGYACAIGLLLVVTYLRPQPLNSYQLLRTSFARSLTKEKHRHTYAVIFCATILMSLVVVEHITLNHGYWAVGTVLIILRPDTKLSIYRGIQRFFGTLVGVLVAEVIIYFVHAPWLAISIITAWAFLAPWALPRSYWLGSAVIAVMLLLLLDLPHLDTGDLITPILRLQATALGCLLALIGVIFMHPKVLRTPPSQS